MFRIRQGYHGPETTNELHTQKTNMCWLKARLKNEIIMVCNNTIVYMLRCEMWKKVLTSLWSFLFCLFFLFCQDKLYILNVLDIWFGNIYALCMNTFKS